MKANSYLKELVHKIVREPLVIPGGSALGLVLSSSLQSSVVASQVAGAVAGAGLLAFEAHHEWKAKEKEVEENRFYFYYKVGKAFSQKGSRRKGRKKSN